MQFLYRVDELIFMLNLSSVGQSQEGLRNLYDVVADSSFYYLGRFLIRYYEIGCN